MSFKELGLKAAYDSDEDDVLHDFYIPVLSESVYYYRLAGFFSSSVLALVAEGMASFIVNNGKMELIVGAKLNKRDVEAIKKGLTEPEKILTESMINELDSIVNEFVKDHVKALAWMIASGNLKIKIAVPLDTNGFPIDENIVERIGIFHQKVGLLKDKDNNVLSFSGSINESAYGWLNNIEEFKVFRSWVDGELLYLHSDQNKIEKYFEGNPKNTMIIDIPTAVQNKLINMAPDNFDAINLIKYYPPKKIILWPHQAYAIQAWKNNRYKGIFAMATGTGKTYAALKASSLSPKSTITVVLVPTRPLLNQWADDIRLYSPSAKIIICAGGHDWKTLLPLELAQYRRLTTKYQPKNRLFILATMHTASSKGFLLSWRGIDPDNVQVICDEVHHLGAPTFQRCMNIPSSRRLGLSATPEREWDLDGTRRTIQYIGRTVFEYNIKDAIHDGYLCHYNYFPYFAFLERKEFEDFKYYTNEISKEIAKINKNVKKDLDDLSYLIDHKTKKLDKYLLNRAKIKKKATDKIRVFNEIIENCKIRPLIVFCEDHEQLNEIKTVIEDKNFLIYTSKMNNWEREKTIDLFKKGDVDILLAIRCLDEGLNVPDCKGCIIVASSSSTREFVQRRGRILRGRKGKIAVLNDIIVLPAPTRSVDEMSAAELLVRQEIARLKQLVEASDNEWEARNLTKRELEPYGLESLALI